MEENIEEKVSKDFSSKIHKLYGLTREDLKRVTVDEAKKLSEEVTIEDFCNALSVPFFERKKDAILTDDRRKIDGFLSTMFREGKIKAGLCSKEDLLDKGLINCSYEIEKYYGKDEKNEI